MKKYLRGILCSLLSATLLLSGCGGTADFTEEAVLHIDGQEIMKSEYMVYLYTTTQELISAVGEDAWSMDFDGQTADELIESHVITTFQNLTAAEKYAAEHNIALTDAEKEEAALAAEEFLAVIPKADLAKMGVDAEKLTAIMEDSYLYSNVYQHISESCTVDDAEVDSFFQENKEGLLEEFQLLQVHSIVVEDAETADEVLEKAKAGEDFSALFDTYDTVGNIDGEGANGEMTVYRYVLEAQYGLSPDAAAGDIEGPFHMGDTYFILKVVDEIAPDEAEVKKLAGETYRSNMQMLLAEDQMIALTENQKVEKIEGVWDALENFH